jgi:hypothetical protein
LIKGLTWALEEHRHKKAIYCFQRTDTLKLSFDDRKTQFAQKTQDSSFSDHTSKQIVGIEELKKNITHYSDE